MLWRQGGRNAIVLKQSLRSESRWSFDLFHELYHASEEPDRLELAVVDDEGTSVAAVEAEASSFAGDVLLRGRAEALAEEAVREAYGRLEWLKSVVPKVALRHDVSVAALANYLAYRLSMQEENWWGAARNLQRDGEDPWSVARDEFVLRANLSDLDDVDEQVLSSALSA
jgi:Zn-dependent peptidase ImmA (M78 family)